MIRRTKQICFGLFGLLLIVACSQLDEFTMFNMSYETNYTIESSTGINLPIELVSPDVNTNAETKFENNNTNKDLIEEIFLESLTLEIESPSGGDFSFLKSIEISIQAEGLSEKQVAWKEDIQNNSGSSLSLETSDDDLKDYLKKDQFQLKLRTTTDEVISEDYSIKSNSQFFVDAKILGQ